MQDIISRSTVAARCWWIGRRG